MQVFSLKNLSTQRWIITAGLGFFYLGAAIDLYERYKYMLTAPFSMWKISFFLVVFFWFSVSSFTFAWIWCPGIMESPRRIRQRMGWARWVVGILVISATIYYFLYSGWYEIFSGNFARLYLYFLSVAFFAWITTKDTECDFKWSSTLVAMLIFGSIFWLASGYRFVQDYPFPFSWSEGNRIWDYSLMYGRGRYLYPPGEDIPAYIDAGRQSLWGLPFLLSNVSIAGVRLWSSIVFTIPYALLGWFIFTPQKRSIAVWLLIGLWVMLFIGQGPIYTPLVLAAILVAASTKERMPNLLGLLLVCLAGYYTYRSRSTWIFAPAMWSAMVAMVRAKRPPSLRGIKALFAYFGKPAAFALAGLSGGYFIPTLIPRIIGHFQGLSADAGMMSLEGIQTTLNRQPLLWDRLLPNPTFAPGILLALLVATVPLVLLLIVFDLKSQWHRRLDFWQAATILGSMTAFFVVGIIVSVKIGGGSNLHNMDMFLLFLLFVAGLAWDAGGREWLLSPEKRTLWVRMAMVAAIVIPVTPYLLYNEPVSLPPEENVRSALDAVQRSVDAVKDSGDVLFIDHRQLLTFGYVQDVPLIAEYEKKRMMDEAMADNAEYFGPFIKDMIDQRFDVIISEMMTLTWQGETSHFGNENDAWVLWVSIPVLCYYEDAGTYSDVGMQILVPRDEVLDDHNIICPVPGKEYPP
jgi:hypothetical protein